MNTHKTFSGWLVILISEITIWDVDGFAGVSICFVLFCLMIEKVEFDMFEMVDDIWFYFVLYEVGIGL